MHFFSFKTKNPNRDIKGYMEKMGFCPYLAKKKKLAICPYFQTNLGHILILVLENQIVGLYKKLDYIEVKYPSICFHTGSPPWLFL